MDKLIHINERSDRLKKQREKMRTQQALLFMRDTQKIFEDDFVPDIALGILSEMWGAASEKQKEEWKKRGTSQKRSKLMTESAL